MAALAWFGLGAAVLIALASWLYAVRIETHDRFRSHYLRYSNPSIQPQVVFFGDSRGAFALRNAAMVDGFLNLSYFGESVLFNALRIEDLLARKTRLRAIVLPVNDYAISTYRFSHDYDRYLMLAEGSRILALYPDEDEIMKRLRFARKWLNYHLPIASGPNRRMLALALLHDAKAALRGATRLPDVKTFDDCLDAKLDRETAGDGPSWPTLGAAQRRELARDDVRRKLAGKSFDPTLAAVMRRAIAGARDRGVRAIGIRHPLTPEWRREAADHTDPAIAAAYRDAGFDRIFDYRDLFDDRPELFHDPDHLSPEGALLYSQRVVRDLAAYLGMDATAPFDCGSVPQ